jgi:hypothetical protein
VVSLYKTDALQRLDKINLPYDTYGCLLHESLLHRL